MNFSKFALIVAVFAVGLMVVGCGPKDTTKVDAETTVMEKLKSIDAKYADALKLSEKIAADAKDIVVIYDGPFAETVKVGTKDEAAAAFADLLKKPAEADLTKYEEIKCKDGVIYKLRPVK